ncbi:MAG: phosphatase PAP2 family protein [Bacteroidetes bacterium]|nr:MAG: phosphatase PAP2 family protein [Bacteroidota bacterium]
MESLYRADLALLLAINHAGTEPWDSMAWYATQSWVWSPLFLVALLGILRRYKKAAWRPISAALLAVGLSDFFCGTVLKPAFGRLRPTHDPRLQAVIRTVRGYRGGSLGFPSNHAANSMALATVVCAYLRHPVIWGLSLSWAFLHSLTRVYLGVHYPSDLLGGWVIGWVIGMVALALLRPPDG